MFAASARRKAACPLLEGDCAMTILILFILLAVPSLAREPLAERIAHTEPSKYREIQAVHAGAGALHYPGPAGFERPEHELPLSAPGRDPSPRRHRQPFSPQDRGDVCDLRQRSRVHDQWPHLGGEGTGRRTLQDGTGPCHLQSLGQDRGLDQYRGQHRQGEVRQFQHGR